jgi:N-acetylneuraminate synthase/N,N'-diacetyllegionaminate synthase
VRQAITIGSRTIAPGAPVYVIAETGVTCNYDVAITRDLIDTVKDAGADAIKFILWFPDEIMSDRTIPYSYETVDGPRSENMYEMLQKLRFTFDQWVEVKRYADSRGVTLFATVNSPSGIEWAEKLGLDAYKLSSWDYNYTPLWRRIARLGKPMVIDTGPVNTAEVAAALRLMEEEGNDQAILVHCPHAETPDEVNMRSVPYMARAFNTLVGFSSKGQESETDIMAVSLGAVVLEKRLTMSRRLPGHHHVLSLEPKEFAAYVKTIRDVQRSLGTYDLRPSRVDLAERKRWFRHLVAARDLPKGTRLTEDMLEGKRPEAGVSPEHLERFVGRVLRRDLRENEAIGWDDV